MECGGFVQMGSNDNLLIVCLYVNDLLVTSSDIAKIDRLMFTMIFFNMEFLHYDNGIFSSRKVHHLSTEEI